MPDRYSFATPLWRSLRHRNYRLYLTVQLVSVWGTWVQPAHIILLGFVLGIVNAFDMPARQALVNQMVDAKDLSNAVALNSSMINAARIVGPSLAGIVVARVGEGACFTINAVSYLAV